MPTVLVTTAETFLVELHSMRITQWTMLYRGLGTLLYPQDPVSSSSAHLELPSANR